MLDKLMKGMQGGGGGFSPWSMMSPMPPRGLVEQAIEMDPGLRMLGMQPKAKAMAGQMYGQGEQPGMMLGGPGGLVKGLLGR